MPIPLTRRITGPVTGPVTGPTRRLSPPTWVLDAVEAWPGTSQRRARRNALLAATALARQRVERLEVEEYLASRPARPGPVVAPVLFTA